eukprot:CAMPEP_0201572520 /NCGR_PEP_ID=MMETSP0190_2-20130828/15845_1 /ASSEMBLY_ACC=CAM_ASM_000263 /TAXON_ID=37353 /ORGANISM="Rosalina sp." /LENGTH=340 /DNA_ID=CAMNT_0047998381 /DNA_START=141 /DNA_END=1159 /DNA_ORIENTATION=+
MYNGDIVVLGGSNWNKNSSNLYKINASLIKPKSESTEWISQEIHGGYPGPIEIKNDNYVTIDSNTYIFGPTLSNKNALYQFNHERGIFLQPDDIDIPPPQTQAANPCVVHVHGFIYYIGGTTYQNEEQEQIACSSLTQAYNLNAPPHTNGWNTYNNEMPWTGGACYTFCQYHEGFIYLFGGVIGGHFPTYLNHVYALDTRNGPHQGMQWKKVSNNSINGGILDTRSIKINQTVYTLSGGDVQTVDLSHPNAVQMTSIKDDSLTPKRCYSGNIFSQHTKRIYAIGGSDCNDEFKYYAQSQISQNMTSDDSNNDDKHWWDIFEMQDWIYFIIGFVVAIIFVT